MKNVKILGCLAALLFVSVHSRAADSGIWGRLPTGPFLPGFRLIEASDASRSFPADGGTGVAPRPVRIYVWYPAKPSTAARLRLDDYVKMALDDFRPAILPVPLAKGLAAADLKAALALPAGAVHDAEAADGKFPLLVFGQGLFYESPFTHFVLCEFLASHGYVVATTPLLGTRYRLVNLSVEDLETEVRDMEFVRAAARALAFVDPEKLGVIGFDLGGMAGLIMCMRNPDVDGFLSMDSGILYKHPSGLPLSHPQYREDRFRIPWMHMTQSQNILPDSQRSAAPSLFDRKACSESYLVHIPRTNHGIFSSYAALGITAEVPGFWGPAKIDPKPIHDGICRAALAFFDACLKREGGALEKLAQAGPGSGPEGPVFKVEAKKGQAVPASEDELVHLIIERGAAKARPAVEAIRASHPGLKVIDENVLNWLGLHFLYWWGREDESLEVFELRASLYPNSWQAYDSLGMAYADRGRKEDAIRSYRKSLELNPENSNAKSELERLSSPEKKDGGGRE